MQYIAIFLDEYLNEIGKKKFDSTDSFITFKKGTFNIRLDAFLYRNNDYIYYVYIYPTDEKLLIDVKENIEPLKNEKLEKLDKPYSARIIKLKERLEHGDLKLIVGENIIGQLARIAVLGVKQNWLLILIIAVSVGIGAGGLGYSLGVSHGQSLVNVTVTPTPIPTIHPTINPYG